MSVHGWLLGCWITGGLRGWGKDVAVLIETATVNAALVGAVAGAAIPAAHRRSKTFLGPPRSSPAGSKVSTHAKRSARVSVTSDGRRSMLQLARVLWLGREPELTASELRRLGAKNRANAHQLAVWPIAQVGVLDVEWHGDFEHEHIQAS